MAEADEKADHKRESAKGFGKWAGIGILLFFAGGLAAHGLTALMYPDTDLLERKFYLALVIFSLGAGIALGGLGLAWILISNDADEKASRKRESAKTFGKWAGIGILLFFAGGLAAHGLTALMYPGTDLWESKFYLALVIFSLGAGIALGGLVLAWTLISNDPFTRTIAVGTFLLLLAALVIWPTPYKYYRDRKLNFVVRVNRVTGDVIYELKGPGVDRKDAQAAVSQTK